MAVNADIFESYQDLAPDASISLYTITDKLGNVFRVHGVEKNGTTANITFNSNEYTAMPVTVEGVEQQGAGKPAPTLIIGTAAALVLIGLQDLDYWLGATVVRIKTQRKFLDGEPTADTSAIEPTQSWIVEQLHNADSQQVTFRLADPTELPGVTIPRQRVLASMCSADGS
jgi:lambda family phage minor tail protein L